VLRDAFRVLKPGGRFAVSDVVAEGTVPEALRRNMEAWVGCLAGALEVATYEQLLADAGFEQISITLTRRYMVAEAGLDPSTLPDGWEAGDGKLASAFVRATKPASAETRTATLPTTSGKPVALASSGACCGGGGCACS
jgi:arsenite methyltransferase